jgi:hypothetical protein
MAEDVEYLFMRLLAICTSFENLSGQFICPIINWIVCPLVFNFWDCMYSGYSSFIWCITDKEFLPSAEVEKMTWKWTDIRKLLLYKIAECIMKSILSVFSLSLFISLYGSISILLISISVYLSWSIYTFYDICTYLLIIYICVYLSIFICICMFSIYMSVFLHVNIYIHTHMCKHILNSSWMHLYIYIVFSVNSYINIYLHI